MDVLFAIIFGRIRHKKQTTTNDKLKMLPNRLLVGYEYTLKTGFPTLICRSVHSVSFTFIVPSSFSALYQALVFSCR